tara:strand:+ start:888 stop:1985 length:1098 start_codon:yes stop_codon:yes gene_type:complete
MQKMNKGIFIYIIFIFILIDITKLNHLWDENIHRRLLHHFQGNQYNPNKFPWIKFITNTINEEELKEINLIDCDKKTGIQNISSLGSRFFGGNYSKKTTLYYNDFDHATQKKLDKIGNRIKPQLEKLCGKKLQLGTSSFRCVLLRYEGINSEFTCHYDTEPHNCYRTLFLVKKEGKIPDFIYYDKDRNKIRKKLNLGDGLFFKGTQTFHCVDKNKDSDMKRYMIGWQYSTDNKIQDDSLCSKLRSKTKFKLFKILFPHLLITITLGLILKYYFGFKLNNKDINKLYIFTALISLMAMMNIFNKIAGIGTKIPMNCEILIKILIISIISFWDIAIGIIFYNYLIITEMLLPTQWLINNNVGLFKNE